MLINSPQPKNSMRYMLKIVAAVLTAPEPTLRPKNCGLSRRRKVATALASRTAKELSDAKQGDPAYKSVSDFCSGNFSLLSPGFSFI